MGKVFKIVRGGVTKVDFLPGGSTAGWKVTDWKPKVSMGGKPVKETITAQIRQTTHDLLATDLQKLDDVIFWVDQYREDNTVEDATWLHASMYAETGERRSLVRSISYEWLTSPTEPTGFTDQNAAMFRITIERGDWERAIHRQLPAGAELAGASIIVDYTSAYDPVGDMPARLSSLIINSDATGANVGRLWIGLRSAGKHGTLANFVNIWECEDTDATLGTDASRETDAGNTASPIGGATDDYVLITLNPGTPGWAKRLTIALVDITANPTDNFGDFIWLLRHKLSAADSTWEVQLRFGYTDMADANFIHGDIIELDNTAWDYAEMGPSRIPLRDLHAIIPSYFGAAYERNYAIQIWARRTSGAAYLWLDCLCPIPTDEGFLKSWNFELDAGNNDYWIFGEGPDGSTYALDFRAITERFRHLAAISNHDFRLPIGDARIICVYAGPTISDITVGISIGGYFFERWLSLRGSE